MVDKKLFTPIYIAETPFVNGQLKPKKAKKSIFELQNSAALNDNIYHFTYRKEEKLIHCFYVVENWDEPERFLFIENNELYDEFTSQFGSEGEAEVGRMDTYLDIDSLESVVEKLTDTIENGYYLEDRVCHLYGQGMWNDKAFIVANRVALEELRDAINMALSNGEFRLSSSTSDNEPYDLFISCVPSVFDWDTIELPYHDETYFNKTKSPVKAFDKYRYKLK